MANGLSHADIEAIIIKGDTEKLVDCAKTLGTALAKKGLTTSQIRNIFGTVREIEMKGFDKPAEQRKLILLKPKLAYVVGKESRKDKKAVLQRLEQALSPAISMVGRDETRFRNFFDFFEAILAYHRAEGGKE
jgi:CRISPR-associated protein Csm2